MSKNISPTNGTLKIPSAPLAPPEPSLTAAAITPPAPRQLQAAVPVQLMSAAAQLPATAPDMAGQLLTLALAEPLTSPEAALRSLAHSAAPPALLMALLPATKLPARQ